MYLQVSVCPQGGICLWSRGMSATHTHTPGQTPPCPVHAGIHTHPHPVHAGIHTPPAKCMLGYTHPPAQCMLGYMPPLCTVHAGIWSTSGRYASHWNAFLSLCVVSAHQQNCGKVMFLQASVSHFVRRGGGWVLNPEVGTHPLSHSVHGGVGDTPRILGDRVDKRAVRILLQCFLVLVKSVTWN